MHLSMFPHRMGWGGRHILGIRQPKQSLPSGIWQTTLAQGRHLRCFSEKTEEIMSKEGQGMGKPVGVDNIPAELVQAGGEAMIDILTSIRNKIWKTGEWPTTWTQSLVITLPKKGNLQLCQNYRTISLISHPSKVMLNIILNRPHPQAEEIIAEE